MSPEDDKMKFGHRPDEYVYGQQVSKPPSIRIRVASPPVAGKLQFEPEGPPQAEDIAAALTPPGVPRSNLAFEPDKGEPLDRVSKREGSGRLVRPATKDDLSGLVKLAASGVEPTAASTQAVDVPGPTGRTDLTGDLEAEMFGPRTSGRSLPATRVEEPAPVKQSAWDDGDDPARKPAGGRSWISVFLSDRVAGRKKKRRRSSIFRGQSAIVSSVAGGAVGKVVRSVGKFLERVDRFTTAYRLPLASIVWSVLISALAVALGVSPILGVVFLAIGLTLTASGVSAHNLLGFAGIIIAAASLAEIVRQRERFFEVFMSFFT